jgi:hypothetical protein
VSSDGGFMIDITIESDEVYTKGLGMCVCVGERERQRKIECVCVCV